MLSSLPQYNLPSQKLNPHSSTKSYNFKQIIQSQMKINSHNHTNDSSDKKQRCQNYIHALEEERHKIQVFQRELPLCFELVTQAIEACKQQLSGTTTEYNLNGQSECSEQTSAPVLEEFMPIKRPSSSSDEHESKAAKNDTNITVNKDEKICNNEKNSKKSDWLRSVQLWNQTPDPPSNEDLGREVGVVEVKRNGAFQPFKKEKNNIGDSETAVVPPVPPASTSSTAETGGAGNKNKEKEGQSQRKSRRCWSPELHKRFLQALQQLGGSHLATPKQIREMMKVDGLTNDEVKSHLQKYRLHTRRPSSSIQNNNNNNNTQTAQFVVVGGIWVPPEYAAMATTANSGEGHTSTGIYAPIASHPTPQRQPPPSDDRGSRSEGGARSHSPATSSSTHTSTASQAY